MKDQLDVKLQELATTDWKQFMEVVGEDFILTAKARIMRKDGKSWQQISLTIGITTSQARTAAKGIKPVKK